MKPATADPVIDEIRAIRHKISELCDHNPAKLVAYFQKIQAQYSNRLASSKPSDATTPSAIAVLNAGEK